MSKLVCPYCERSFNIDAVEDAGLWRERAELAAKLGPAWQIANEYLEAFRSSRGSRLSLKKQVRILGEISRLWESQRMSYDGKIYKIGQGEIMKGLQVVCNADKTGMQNHNYLKKVLFSGAERVSAEGMTATEERNREQLQLSQRRRDAEEFLSPGENAKRAREIAKGIGRRLL